MLLLNILGPPSAPSSLRVLTEGDTATISWTAPLFLGSLFSAYSEPENSYSSLCPWLQLVVLRFSFGLLFLIVFCFLAGSDAFDNWTYVVKYCIIMHASTCLENSTMELLIQLTLSFNMSYAVSVRAMGRDGQSTESSEVVFTTEPNSKPPSEDYVFRKITVAGFFLSVQM